MTVFSYLIMLNITKGISDSCMETDIFIIIYVTLMKDLLQKVFENAPVRRGKLNCYSLGDRRP